MTFALTDIITLELTNSTRFRYTLPLTNPHPPYRIANGRITINTTTQIPIQQTAPILFQTAANAETLPNQEPRFTTTISDEEEDTFTTEANGTTQIPEISGHLQSADISIPLDLDLSGDISATILGDADGAVEGGVVGACEGAWEGLGGGAYEGAAELDITATANLVVTGDIDGTTSISGHTDIPVTIPEQQFTTDEKQGTFQTEHMTTKWKMIPRYTHDSGTITQTTGILQQVFPDGAVRPTWTPEYPNTLQTRIIVGPQTTITTIWETERNFLPGRRFQTPAQRWTIHNRTSNRPQTTTIKMPRRRLAPNESIEIWFNAFTTSTTQQSLTISIDVLLNLLIH
jgi:hypothetical protein